MKKILSALMLCLCAVVAYGQNYPDIYLRGAMTDNWSALDEYRFAREGNLYSLHLDRLDGEFKIADADWDVADFGSPSGVMTIAHNSSFELAGKGSNLKADNLTDITLKFIYEPGDASITLVTDGEPDNERPVQGLSGTLPVLYINVYTDETLSALDNEVIDMNLDHKNYFTNARYYLDTNGCEWLKELGATDLGSKDEPLALQIKARGNWTRIGFSKKPFKLKLDKKASMLGMSKSKHYALLAHADDNRGYLRNFTGFELGKRIGLPWTPSQQPVEVVINGDYRGLYFLTESIRIDSDRVDIEELDDNCSDPALASGGYLVELDNYDEDNQIRLDERTCTDVPYLDKLRITFDTPEEYSELQRRFVTDQFTAMNNAVGDNSDVLWSYLDLDDAARYYIVEEIISHIEAYHGSTYLYRDRGADRKWHFSPLWDCGNAFNGPTDDFFYRHGPYGNTWIPSMRCNDTFNAKVKATWLWFMANEYEGIADDIALYTSRLKAAAAADRRRWADAPVPSGGQSVSDNTDIDRRRDEVLAHLNAKTAWLKGQFGDYSAGTYTEPERDTTPAAALPDYLSTGVEEIGADVDGHATYYNLQGMPVANPGAGIYIERRGSQTRKVVINK